MTVTDEFLTIERVAVLQRVTLFGEVPGHTLVAVARLVEEVAFEAGATVMERGTVEDWLFVVANGRVRVNVGERTIAEHGPGGVVGELAVLAPAPRSATVTALEPSLLLRLRRGPFEELIEDRPDIARGHLDTGQAAAGHRGRQPRSDTSVTPDPGASDPATRRILAVAGQGFTLGLTTAWMTIPASAIVLDSYGPRVLPFTYIGAAVAGAASSALLTRALRNRSVAAVATSVLTGLVLILVASWIALSAGGSDLVAVGLLVLVPIMVPVGFVFLVGQAGALVDLQRAQDALRACRRRLRARIRRRRAGWPSRTDRRRRYRAPARGWRCSRQPPFSGW